MARVGKPILHLVIRTLRMVLRLEQARKDLTRLFSTSPWKWMKASLLLQSRGWRKGVVLHARQPLYHLPVGDGLHSYFSSGKTTLMVIFVIGLR